MTPPDFLYAALDTTACAAFIKESRMKFVNANQFHRKSGSCSRPHLLSNESAMVSYPIAMRPSGYYQRVRRGAVTLILL
jgi:hypothetical protein